MIGLSQTKASNQLTSGCYKLNSETKSYVKVRQVLTNRFTKFWEVAVFLFSGTKLIDGIHNQWGLNTESWAVTWVDSFHFTSQETVSNRGDTSATISLNRGTKDSQLTHLTHNFLVENLNDNWRLALSGKSRSSTFISVGVHHSGHEFFLAVSPEAVTDETLIFCQLGFEIQGIPPVKHSYRNSSLNTLLSRKVEWGGYLPFSTLAAAGEAEGWARVLWNLTEERAGLKREVSDTRNPDAIFVITLKMKPWGKLTLNYQIGTILISSFIYSISSHKESERVSKRISRG